MTGEYIGIKGVKATSWTSVLVPDDGDPRHGLNGYTNLGCRCDECRAANAAYNREAREWRKKRPVPDSVPHGLDSTYCNYRCKCEPCRAAHAKATRESNARRKASTGVNT